MAKLRLHLDADTSIKALHIALVKQGHDVTRTPNDWIAANASDVEQLMGAVAQERCIFTFNIRDFGECRVHGFGGDRPSHVCKHNRQ